jgi:hypothetical protein
MLRSIKRNLYNLVSFATCDPQEVWD